MAKRSFFGRLDDFLNGFRENDVRKNQYFEHPPRSHLFHEQQELIRKSQLVVDEEAAGEEVTSEQGGAGGSAGSKNSDPPGGAQQLGKKVLSPMMLLGLMYTYTIGGGYGIEDCVQGGGPFLCILSIITIPLLMGIPTALVVTELATAIPSNAGFLMWINIAFHRTVYFAMVLMTIILISVDNALYPVLFSDYLCTVIPCTNVTTKLLRLGMLIVTYILNILGIQAVGYTSVLLSIFTISPFVLMLLIHLLTKGFYINWPALAYIPSSINWAQFITTASWNLSGLEQAGTVAEEVQNPQKTILRALVPLMGLAFLSYIPPILTGASTQKGGLYLPVWTTGYWTTVAFEVGGLPLKYWTVLGDMVSDFGSTNSALCTTSRVIAGMALTEAFPGRVGLWLSQRNKRFGSYHWALTLNAVVTTLFSTLLEFGPLVKVDQFLYGLRVTLIFLSFLRIRQKYPHLYRPFRIPLDGWKLVAAFIIPTLSFIGLTGVAMSMDIQTVEVCLGVFGAAVAASCLYCFTLRRQGFQGRVVTLKGAPKADKQS